jgi:hypothetical protein
VTQILLTAIFDSEITNIDSTSEKLIEDLTGRDNTLFKLLRTKYRGSVYEKLESIAVLPEIRYERAQIQQVLSNLDILKMKPTQEHFFYSMLKYARHVPNNVDYILQSVFITEDLFFLKRFLPQVGKHFGLRTFFPNLLLVDLEGAVRVFDLYEKKLDSLLFKQ